ncbi:tripartite tricarboxylate transporter substrate binding protein [soil metagenome]
MTTETNHPRRRTLLLGAAGLMASATGIASAQATYPSKPIRLIVPFTGGVTDTLARLLSKQLGEQLAQPVVVDVKGGAGGLIGSGLASRSAPDGYSLLLGTSSLAIGAALNPTTEFDPERDLTPVATVLSVPYVLVSNSKGKLNSLRDVVAAGAKGGKGVNYGSPGVGSGPHLVGELLKNSARLEARHIPYNGGAAQITALLSGEIDVAFLSLVTALPQVKEGTLRALAVTSIKPVSSLPDVPTLHATYADIPDTITWFAVFAPKDTPAALRDRLQREVETATASPAFVEQRASLGAEVPGGGHVALGKLLSSERARWAALIREANIKA